MATAAPVVLRDSRAYASLGHVALVVRRAAVLVDPLNRQHQHQRSSDNHQRQYHIAPVERPPLTHHAVAGACFAAVSISVAVLSASRGNCVAKWVRIVSTVWKIDTV